MILVKRNNELEDLEAVCRKAGLYTILDSRHFANWSAYILEVEDDRGNSGTLIYVPNVPKDKLFR